MTWSDADMWEAWAAGFKWCADRAEIVEGELWLPHDRPGIEGFDHREACGDWMSDYEIEAGDPNVTDSAMAAWRAIVAQNEGSG